MNTSILFLILFGLFFSPIKCLAGDNKHVLVHPESGYVYGIFNAPTINASTVTYLSKTISPDHPALNKNQKYLVWDFNLNDLKIRDDVQNIKNIERKENLRKEIRQLLIKRHIAIEEGMQGFDVSQDTTTIRNKIDTMKAEYQTLE